MASFLDDVSPPKGTLRLVLTSAAMIVIILVLFPVQLLASTFRWRLARRIPVMFHRAFARIIGLRLDVVGKASADRPMLIVSNHVSWIDIVVLGSVMPLSFVAKSEVADWPIFGLMAKLQRSIFVDRNRRGETAKANEEIAGRLEEGDPIVLFAESTTSDGNRLLPFRSALVGAARSAILSESATRHVCLQPVALAYNGRDGLPTGRMGRAQIGWYGDMDMFPHLVSILRGGPLDVTLQFGTPLSLDEGSDRKALTRQAEHDVRRMMTANLNGRAQTITPNQARVSAPR